ncbi:cellulose-binding domain-containing protein [Catenuloplanes sp. NPDC051500]|uniref:cellulose-binding domain-containing protein n=1 Tax=Catenuloplanes sp. NPDC051500 TaxID=3363959 RepID=UPI00378D1416
MASARHLLAGLVAALVAIGAGWALAPVAQAAAGCAVDYTVNQWSGGFTANVRVSPGSAAVTGWTVTWAYPGDSRITSAWNAQVTQTGTAVTATNLAWNGSIPANGAAEFGVQGTFVSGNGAPTGFTLNGVPCNGGATPTTPPSPTPTPTPTPTPSPGTGCGTGTVLCDDFESQTGTAPAGAWAVSSQDCSGLGTATVDSSAAHSGTRSIKVTGAAGYCNHVFIRTVPGAFSFGRFYVRHTTALPAAHVTFLAMRDTNDGNTDLRMGGQNAALQWNRQSDDATLPEQSPAGVALSRPLPLNAWTCVEFRVDGAGQLQTWVDGAEVTGLRVDGVPTPDVDRQWLTKTWRPALTDFRLGWEGYGDGADTLWYDDVALGASRIGC